jgi:hypothetical protein
MRVADRTAQKDNKPSGAAGQALQGLGKMLSRGKTDVQAILVNSLQKTLDNQYTLCCKVTLPGLELVIPFVLVGPNGIWMIYDTDIKGVYRAKENAWEELNSRSQSYRAVKPNLLATAAAMAKAVEKHLSGLNEKLPAVEPVLFFVNPGVHVDTSRPAVRIVMPDALDRFGASLAQGEAVLETLALQKVLNVLGGSPQRPAAEAVADKDDAFSLRETKVVPKPPKPSTLDRLPRGELAAVKKLNFTRRQWMALGVMLGFTILILVIVVVVAVLMSF